MLEPVAVTHDRVPTHERSGAAEGVASRHRRVAWTIVALAFFLRLGWGLAADVTPGAGGADDAFWYHRTATTLAEGGGYLSPFTAQPTAAWPPGYPLGLALLYRVAGATPAVAVAANAVFGGLTCWLVWQLGLRLGGARLGLAAAALLAAFPGQIFFAALVLSETLCTCLAYALWLAAVRLAAGEVRGRAWVWWGMALGATALVRAEMIAFVLVPALTFATRGRRGAAARILVATLLGAVVALTPWTVRNARVFGAVVPTSTSFGRTFWIGHNPQADGAMRPALQQTMQGMLTAAGLTPIDPAHELAGNRMLLREALAFAAAHPGRELRLTGARVYHLFRGDHVWQSWYEPGTPKLLPSPAARRWLGRLGDAYYLAIGLLAVVGWWRRRRARVLGWRLLEVAALVWVGMYACIYGDPRFHHVLMPMACLLAAAALGPDERDVGATRPA